MATLQVPPRLSAQTSHMFDDFDSSPSLASPSVSSSDMQEHTKKTMQTTIAIRDEKPHHFKIRPLKQVPVEKRLAMESPCMNFDRPFAGPRLELPTLYQLAPNRSASGCSFNSLKDEDPSTSRPGTPPSQEQCGRGLSSASVAKLDCANYADNLSGLGLKACDSLTGSLASLRSTVGDISQEDIAETLQEYNVSQASFLHPWSAAPDLTFESSNELSLSVSPGLVTPLTSTPSSENVRKNKTKSMHVTAISAGLAFISNLPLDPPSLGRTAILERRKHTHTKAFSVSSLSSGHGHPDEGTRIHSRKRHAIYGDSEWQVDLPASDSHSSSVGSSGSSTSLPYATPEKRKHTSTARHSSAVRPVSLGNGLGIHSSAPIPTVPSIPSIPSFEKSVVLPLRVSPSGMSSVKSSTSVRRGSRSRDSLKAAMVWPPMVQEMLQELDEAIQEWQFACFVATF